MQEKKQGVKRLLKSIYQNIDESNITILSEILNYHEPQLREDIEAINFVDVIDRDEAI